METQKQTEYLTKKGVCHLLKISISTVDSLSRQGVLKRYAIGRRILFKRHQVESALMEV